MTPMGSTTNLLDDRNNRMKKRLTTTSFNALATTPNVNTIVPSSIDGNVVENPNATDSKEDLTLAERKALIDQGAIQPNKRPQSRARPPSAQGPHPALARVNSTSNQNLIYDSHQPKRANTVDKKQQNAMLTQWRQSLQQQAGTKPNTAAEEQARIAMINHRRRSDYRHHKEKADRETRENMREIAMRTGQLTNAHQDAMRRMQAKANTAAKE